MLRVPRAVAALCCGLLLSGLLAGCSGNEAAAPPPPPTPIAKLNTASMAIGRVPFCDLIGKDAVNDALGGSTKKKAKKKEWGNGDIIEIAPETAAGEQKDVVHEFGCSFTRGETVAEAWIYARPVTPAFAKGIVALTKPGCVKTPGPAFGSPHLARQCGLPNGLFSARHAGLFGQTWLTCQLTGPAPTPGQASAVGQRAGAWCVQVANAVNARD